MRAADSVVTATGTGFAGIQERITLKNPGAGFSFSFLRPSQPQVSISDLKFEVAPVNQQVARDNINKRERNKTRRKSHGDVRSAAA